MAQLHSHSASRAQHNCSAQFSIPCFAGFEQLVVPVEIAVITQHCTNRHPHHISWHLPNDHTSWPPCTYELHHMSSPNDLTSCYGKALAELLVSSMPSYYSKLRYIVCGQWLLKWFMYPDGTASTCTWGVAYSFSLWTLANINRLIMTTPLIFRVKLRL